MKKRKQLTMTFQETIFPLAFTSRYKHLYAKIDTYVKQKLSLDNLLKESDEFEKLKKYTFSPSELYLFENIDRFKTGILSPAVDQPFDHDKFKKAFLEALTNQKLQELIS
jgi:hypothetical protein